ncbi:MAG TPA: hypothetical protein VFS43_08160, partial [Polyangiaceae bacterium]|nr:hypothetical protein [Polyangiaceae bacterium]
MLASPLLMDCGKGGGLPGGLGKGLPVPGACPNMDDPGAVANASFGLQGEVEGKVKASLTAASQLKALSAQIEGDVVTACSGLAKDLGATDADLKPAKDEPGAKAEHACNVAVKFLGQAKAEAKAAGKMEIVIVEPKCNASLKAAADCAGSCDVSATGGKAEVKCEGGKLSGKCDAECSGKCEVKAGAQCGGTCSAECSGKCEGTFSGKCDGDCQGTCDGKNAKGKCAGKCDGKCTAGGSGTCSGKCQGTCSGGCEVDAKGKCEGTCTGGCSVEMKEPKCTGDVQMPKVSAECKAKCDAELATKLECTPARVKVVFAGDAKAGAKLATALEKNLPLMLKVAVGMKGRAQDAVASVKASVEGVQGLAASGDAAIKAGACIAAALKAQAEAAVSINVSVKASVSASASAKGS